MLCSNLSKHTGYLNWGFHGVLQSLQGNIRIPSQAVTTCALLATSCLLGSFFDWRWRWHVRLKRWLIFDRLNGIIFQKTELFMWNIVFIYLLTTENKMVMQIYVIKFYFIIQHPFFKFYVGYPESKFRWAIKKRQVFISKPFILPFDVHTLRYFST
jgi:hypothetical protein